MQSNTKLDACLTGFTFAPLRRHTGLLFGKQELALEQSGQLGGLRRPQNGLLLLNVEAMWPLQSWLWRYRPNADTDGVEARNAVCALGR